MTLLRFKAKQFDSRACLLNHPAQILQKEPATLQTGKDPAETVSGASTISHIYFRQTVPGYE